ncbi:MAG TPA: Panacea domain-containing protein [Candidatus Dormibacteraeota bacterium]|nr:Panacea domain-containing protein [Candidatus Dormibacteraeota bacterium]
MGDIKFEFNLDKLIQAIAFFCDKGIQDLTKLKVAKLLYFADKKHLLEHGEPILGDTYFCMQFGPVPSFSLNEMNEAISRSEVSSDDESDYSIMSRTLRVRRGFFHYPRFEARHPFDASVFTGTELAALTFVAERYGANSAKQLVDLTHLEPTWTIANEGRQPNGRTQIPYELFFEGASEEALRQLARLKAEFCGEAIALRGDADYRAFGQELRSYDFEPSLELDSDQVQQRSANHPV